MAGRLSISIALCTLNGAEFLEDQLESIAQQSRQPDELVICDDNSEDSTISICERFCNQAKFPVIIQRNLTTLGVARNYEQAIGLCTGDIIALADQDDFWLPEKLASIEEVFLNNQEVDLVFSDADVVDTDLCSMKYSLWRYLNFKCSEIRRIKDGDGIRVLLQRNVVTGATMAFSSTLRETVLPIPPGWIHDEWIALIASVQTCLHPIGKPLILYRQSPNHQIGAVKHSLRARVKRAQYRDLQIVQKRIDMLQSSRERLAAMGEDSNRKVIMNLINEKIGHLMFRSSLPAGFWGRLGLAVNELIAHRYHQYSKGFYSFARDVFLNS